MTQIDSLSSSGAIGPARRSRRWYFLLPLDSYTLASNLNFMTAIRMLYLAQHGLPLFVIALLETERFIVQFLAEIPTGIFADLLGKRRSLVCFCILIALQSLLFLVPVIPLVALGYTLGGIAWAFYGGTNEALVWQMARSEQPAQVAARYSQLVSRMYLVVSIASILGSALSGVLGNLLSILPFLATAAVSLLALFPLHFLPEPAPPGILHRPQPLAHLKEGIRATWRDPALLGWILLAALTSSCWHTIFFFSQLYLQSLGFPLPTIGLVIALSTGSYCIFTLCAPFMMRSLSVRLLLPACLLAEMSGLLCMCASWPVANLCGYLVLLQAGAAVLSPVISTAINRRSPETQRVTILSCKTAIFDAAMIVLFPLFGLGISRVPYNVVYVWTLGALIAGCLIIGGMAWLRTRGASRTYNPAMPEPIDGERAATQRR